MEVKKEAVEFEWDKGNTTKNWEKHGVSRDEAEQAFYDERKLTTDDVKHSHVEPRYILLGKTKTGRLLSIVYTIRNRKLRIISARDASKKEVFLYE
jgi:uncharacterized protein